MNLRRIRTLYRRDLVDAIRDGRILVAIIIPVALAIFYAVSVPDPNERVPVTLALHGPRSSQVVEQVRSAVQRTVDLTVTPVTSARAADRAARDDPDTIGLSLPADVDRRVAAGSASGELFVPRDSSSGADLAAAAVAQVAARADDRPFALDLDTTLVGDAPNDAFEVLGLATALGIFSIVMLAGFIGLLVIPVLLVEEVALGTLEALQLVATGAEIIVAKLAVGMTYCAVAIGITLAASPTDLHSVVGYAAAALALSIALAGFGLAFGLALGDSGRINTWAGVVLTPVLIPVFFVLGDDQPWRTVGQALPTGAAAQLMAQSANPAVDQPVLVPLLVIAAWLIAGFALLRWLLDRRSA
ncbi:MAG: type transporter [Thermoleophilia bacterium]|nr:type transporter [Thermoleophilia bacterium]